jgi:hypothetical protein
MRFLLLIRSVIRLVLNESQARSADHFWLRTIDAAACLTSMNTLGTLGGDTRSNRENSSFDISIAYGNIEACTGDKRTPMGIDRI